ncbi:MAG: recombinase RecA [Methanosarcinales archaeon]|nr:MAG: recombinase RecA [Methanosarcinales archaeon]
MTGYKLGISELNKILGDVRGGSNIMLIGPAMCKKDSLVCDIIHASLLHGENVILVTTEETGSGILKWFKQHELGINRGQLGIVDGVSTSLGVRVSDTENIKMAPSPLDLTGIGIKISEFLRQFDGSGKQKTRLIINSLSTMLMYSNLQTVFRFLHVFTGRIKVADAIGIYVLEAGMHDDKTVATLKKLFDGVIEIKEESGEFFIKAMGLGVKPTRWIEYNVDRTESMMQIARSLNKV